MLIWQYEPVVYAQHRICPGEWVAQSSLGFYIQTNPLIPDQVIANKEKKIRKRTCRTVNFPFPADHWLKIKESGKSDKYLDLSREQKKSMEHAGDGDTNCNWSALKNRQRIIKGTWRLENERTTGDYPDRSIIKISQNTEKSPGDLMWLAVTLTLV